MSRWGLIPWPYYPVQGKGENACRGFVLRPFRDNCSRANSRYSHAFVYKFHLGNQIDRAENTLLTDSRNHIPWLGQTHEIISLFRTGNSKLHTLSSGTSPYRLYKGVISPGGGGKNTQMRFLPMTIHLLLSQNTQWTFFSPRNNRSIFCNEIADNCCLC